MVREMALVKDTDLQAEAKWEKASREFIYFLDFVYLEVPPQPIENVIGGKVSFEMWPYLIELAEALSTETRLVVCKARRLGFSWICAARAVWLFMFHPGANIAMLSKSEVDAWVLKDKASFIYRNLPEHWQKSLKLDSRAQMSLEFEEGVTSHIKTFASTKNAGRGESFTAVFQDEADFHEFAAENLMAVLPAMDGGGQHVTGSTVNYEAATSAYQSTILDAPGNGYKLLFYPWTARPGRDQDWYEREKSNVPETTKINPDVLMQKEHPGSLAEALAPARSASGFDMAILQYMRSHLREPMMEFGNVRVYTKYQVGRRYACGTDVAHGIGQDYSVSTVVDLDINTVVACVIANQLDTADFADETMEMLKLYKNPLWAIERNDWGIDVVRAAERVRYMKLYGVTKSTGRENGWLTTTKSRYDMWLRLRSEVNRGAVVIPDSDMLDHFFEIIIVGEHGKLEARRGGHDDAPTAMAIALMMNEQVHVENMEPAVVGSRF